MTTFVILAIVLSVAVLLAVLWPLWRDARGLVLAGVATLGVATFALYRVVGTPAALEPQATAAMPTTLEEAIGQLEAELQKKPNEPEGWRLLGKSYAALQRYADAQKAFERAVQLMPDDADLLVNRDAEAERAHEDAGNEDECFVLGNPECNCQQGNAAEKQHERDDESSGHRQFKTGSAGV